VQARDPLLLGLGQAIKELRKQRGLNQEELADKGGAHRTYVGEVERAETNPTVPKVAELAVALEIPLSELLARAERRAGIRGVRGPKGTSGGDVRGAA